MQSLRFPQGYLGQGQVDHSPGGLRSMTVHSKLQPEILEEIHELILARVVASDPYLGAGRRDVAA